MPIEPTSRRKEPNVVAWVLAALLAFSVLSHYVTGSKFDAACVRAEAVLERLGPAVSGDREAMALEDACRERLDSRDLTED